MGEGNFLFILFQLKQKRQVFFPSDLGEMINHMLSLSLLLAMTLTLKNDFYFLVLVFSLSFRDESSMRRISLNKLLIQKTSFHKEEIFERVLFLL